MNQTELAHLTGTSQRNISKLELGETAKPKNWREIADALGIPREKMETAINHAAFALGRPGKAASRGALAAARIDRRTPIVGRASAGEPGKLTMMHTEYDTIQTPHELDGVDGWYAVYVYGDSMEPRFMAGELLLVHPLRPVARGDFCIVQINDDEAYVKQYLGHADGKLRLRQLNPAAEIEFPAASVKATHRIVGVRMW